MTSTIKILNARRILGRERFSPPEVWGPDGWRLVGVDRTESIVISSCVLPEDPEKIHWIHASWAGPERVPDYEEMVLLHRAVWGENGYSYQMQVPVSSHINIHPYALHLWGRADGKPVMPDFGLVLGTI